MGERCQKSEFTLSGRFLGYVFKDGYKIKRLRLETSNGEYSIKLTKEARASLQRTLLPGDQIQVRGLQKLDRKTGSIKLKAFWIQPLSAELSAEAAFAVVKSTPAAKPAKMSVLVCQKSSCMKRGGKAICKALEGALSDRGLEDQVNIQGTGCMKDCGKGPNVIFMPGKERYTKVSAKDIPALVDEHFMVAAVVPKAEEKAAELVGLIK